MKLKPTFCFGALTVCAFAASSTTASPTYNKDIAPILFKNCANCHRAGEVAPFSLMTYQDAAKRAGLIAAVTKSHVMPPWKPEPGHGDFKDARVLTDEQLGMLQQWAKNGAPEGDPALKPTPPKFAEGWLAGQPDKTFTLPAKFTVNADGPDQYRCFVLPLDMTEDVYLGAMEFRPDNRRVVHHALVFSDPNHQGKKLAAGSADGTYSCFGGPGFTGGLVGGWAPGQVPAKAQPGYSTPLRKGTDLVLQIHYHPDGKAEDDRSSLGLTFAPPPTKGKALLLLGTNKIDIAPGDSQYVVKASRVLPADASVVAIAPHAHYICKDMKVDAYLPDGTVKPLIWIQDWDFNWQGGYRYAAPVNLPKGTRVEMVYTYDNSADNARNPTKPPMRVVHGEETTNEMALAFISLAFPTPADAAAFQRALYISARQ